MIERILNKSKRIDLGRFGYRIALYDDRDEHIYIESMNKDNRFNAMYTESLTDSGWKYYYDELEGFIGGWMNIDPTDLINLVKITNYLTSGI